MISYPDRLNLAQIPTPFHRLDRLTEQLRSQGAQCPQLWIKRDDQTGNLTSGNKVRKLEFLLAEARAQGCDTLITSGGVQSNHCRATAVLGTQLGFRVHLLLRSDTEPQPVGNLLIDQLVLHQRLQRHNPCFLAQCFPFSNSCYCNFFANFNNAFTIAKSFIKT